MPDIDDEILYGNEREHEFEHQYGVPYGQHSINVNREVIDSNEFKECFYKLSVDGFVLSPEVCNMIYKYAQKVVIDNAGTLFESMYILDAKTGEQIAAIDKEEEKHENEIHHSIDFDQAIKDAKDNKRIIIAIHNHPEGYPPSLDDISEIAKSGYDIALAIGGNGIVYQYFNYNNTVFSTKVCNAVHDTISLDIIRGMDPDRAHDIAYKQLNVGYQIIGGGKYGK